MTLVFATNGFSMPVTVGQHVKLSLSGGNANGGGEFLVEDWSTGKDLLNTFCLEYNEEFYLEHEYVVWDISKNAVGGGMNTGDPLSSTKDPLDPKTAYLYWNYTRGSLTGFTGTDESKNALQEAIWYIEGEIGGIGTGGYHELAHTFYDEAVAADWKDIGNVRVINLAAPGDSWPMRQDQLTVVDPVPEPTTILLSGIGLLGMGLFLRRKTRPSV